MEAIESEELIDLDLILYDLDKANLRWASKQELDKLVRYLQARPELRVELSSHTDSRASFEYNQDLSQRRAQSCVDYIIGQGVSSTRIIARGYGETQLVNHCGDGVECSEELHQQNRRTELRLLTD
jgi:outer membrane protein OmpA-like peptidoglycan-associated protein